ncbi:MAG: twin-arginine translocase TatA/TatE family subunit [Chloroflexota bacterium]
MELFGVGLPEIGIVLLIALVIVGPQRFPEVAREVARWINTARGFTDSVMTDIRAAVDELEQDVSAANDGVNPIRELQALRQDLTGAVQDASSTLTSASTLAALPEPTSDEATPTESTDGTTATDGEHQPAEERTATS